ncbi:MAG: NADH-quinone oxidoreductase subunit C [Spirochaetales bacterium]|nr:NADH-quinone oxidoreductase subunit C [Spirochaetales bacterium]
MNTQELYDILKFKNTGGSLIVKNDTDLEIAAGPRDVSSLLIQIKHLDFNHLSCISCIDWIDKNLMTVVYNIWSYKHSLRMFLKTDVNRNDPELTTISDLWPHAQVYEQEIHEMFGVRFRGNPDLGPLFLYEWKDIPPLRKDFDSKEYSRRVYGIVGEE